MKRKSVLQLSLTLFFICGSLMAPASGIREEIAIPIGGIQQWITLDGANDQNPVLLFLHGGPGNSVMGYADKFTSELQKHFVVVQWDQRASGKTEKLNSKETNLTVALMMSDAVEVVNYLRKRFSKEKIYLAGHSWGGFLALEVAVAHPELLAACIPSAPMINQLESERGTLEWLLTNAKAKSNKEAIGELEQVRIPFENGDQLYFDRRWLQLSNKKNPISRSFINKWAMTWLALFNEACAINLFAQAPELRCPVYFLVGSTDRQADSKITERYFLTLKAEKKDLIWFTNSGHNLNVTEPEKYQQTIISLLTETAKP
ncbi:MAG TPA: alpha/beta hydrolase [Cyclobacteriaceae bacterium]|nr:alpha/beta hydrolase [Cyclobacteriaceae bacterium]